MDDCCNNKASYEQQNNQFNGIVDSLRLDRLANSSEDVHCSNHSSDNILNEMVNLSPRLHDVAENTLQHLENNAHSLLSDGNVLESPGSLEVADYSNGDNTQLQIAQVENMGETTMLLDSHYYNVFGYDLSQACVGAFETLIVGSSIKAGHKDNKRLEIPIEHSEYLQNNVLVVDPTYCEVPAEQYQEDQNNLCTKNMVAEICSGNASEIILENQTFDKDAKFIELSQQISEEFNFDIPNSLTESPRMITESHIHIDGNFSPSNDAASEVALTLANLGNMEPHHYLSQTVENVIIDQSKIVIANMKENSESNLLVNSKKYEQLSHDPHDNTILKVTNSEFVAKNGNKRQRIHSIDSIKQKKSGEFSNSRKTDDTLLSKYIQVSEQHEVEPSNAEGVNDDATAEGVIDDVIPAVGYRIMDMYNLSEMVCMMHNCTADKKGPVVIQEQVSQREGAVSHISLICTACQEGTVCPTSNHIAGSLGWDINSRVEKLKKEFKIEETELQKMLEILGIFYRSTLPLKNVVRHLPNEKTNCTFPKKVSSPKIISSPKKIKKKDEKNSSKEKNFECDICKQKFLLAHHLKRHLPIHNMEGHTCPYCHAYFKKKYNLREHIKKHENVKYECNLCCREYTDRSTLMKHMSSFHEEKSIAECEHCGKKFYHRSHYNEHIRIHTEEKPYFCKLCGKKFKRQESCKKHMASH